jgi:Mrp family chromosome partitioning ATPase
MTEMQRIDPLDQVASQLASSAGEKSCVLGVAGCRSGDGATFVSQALAASLALRTDEQVLETSITDLLCCAGESGATILGSCLLISPRNLWRLVPPRQVQSRPHAAMASLKHLTELLANRFRFIVLDCGAVSVSGTLWPVAQIVDDLLLVVAAGETKKTQIAYAQRLVARSGAHLAGCILNKRTYPLPKTFYRLLA